MTSETLLTMFDQTNDMISDFRACWSGPLDPTDKALASIHSSSVVAACKIVEDLATDFFRNEIENPSSVN